MWAIPIPRFSPKNDKLVWDPSYDGNFSYKSVYLLQTDNKEDRYSSSAFKCLWLLDVLPSIKTFLWLATLDRLPTRNLLKARSIIEEEVCPGCNLQPKSVLHVLRDCYHSKLIWNLLSSIPLSTEFFYPSNIPIWLKVNCLSNKSSSLPHIGWKDAFLVMCWLLWFQKKK
ncbi:zf-RVT domain-containing protein [Cephalotus follicularis]|uniref:Zf-RVT domain-containing protein n=1 Tax=Cephalotus follicularis TaxID=3775 RepID=A0A1Q3C173_CEPFO|nr:zf-RVT domain-containing protein [Cephalotus follicularis]